jgi:Holliday junction resolvase RusA-like endonuclease
MPGDEQSRMRLAPTSARAVTVLRVDANPATYNAAKTQAYRDWTAAVRAEATKKRAAVPDGARYSLRIEFRLPRLLNPNQEWDLDNLLKSTFDAMADEELFGPPLANSPMRGDERIDHLEVRKRRTRDNERAGADIEIRIDETPQERPAPAT